jgi:nucleotide-binding universal stress UspA family protein
MFIFIIERNLPTGLYPIKRGARTARGGQMLSRQGSGDRAGSGGWAGSGDKRAKGSKMTDKEGRFKILVCIDGSESSYMGLRYAIKFSLDSNDTDISLLYVRPDDRSGSSEGLSMGLARENMLDWDLELPGLKALKKARDILVENSFLGEEWEAEDIQKKARGSRLGNHILSYHSKKTDQHIALIVRTSSSVLAGILDEAYENMYDLVIVSSSDQEHAGLGAIDNYTAVSVATEHDGSVILSRELEEGHGHLVCITDDVEASLALALKDAEIASRCGCPIHLYAVAENNEKMKTTEKAVEAVRKELEKEGYSVAGTAVDMGDPVGRILEKGKQYSLIVLAATEKSVLRRMFLGSVSHEVLKKAKSSVMILR